MPSVIERLVAVHRDHLGCPDLGERIGEVIGGVSEKKKKKLWATLERLDLDPGFRGVLRARLGVKLDMPVTYFSVVHRRLGMVELHWYDDGLKIEKRMRIEDTIERARLFVRNVKNADNYNDFPHLIGACGMGSVVAQKFEQLSEMNPDVCLHTLGVRFSGDDYISIRQDTSIAHLFAINPFKYSFSEFAALHDLVARKKQRYASSNPNIKEALEIYLNACIHANEFSNVAATLPELYSRLKIYYLRHNRRQSPDEEGAKDDDIVVPPTEPGPRKVVVVPFPRKDEQKRGGPPRWEPRDDGDGGDGGGYGGDGGDGGGYGGDGGDGGGYGGDGGGDGGDGQSDWDRKFDDIRRKVREWYEKESRKDGRQERGRSEEEKPERSKRASKQFADTVYKSYSSKTRGDGTFGEGDDADVAEQVIFQDKSGTQFADPLDELVYKYNTQAKNKEFFKHYSANFDKRAADGITRGSKKRSKEGFEEPGVRRAGKKDFEEPGPRKFEPDEVKTIEV